VTVVTLTVLAVIPLSAASAFASAPSNDNFDQAIVINGDSGDLSGSNVGATGQAGEPDHAGASLAAGCANATTTTSGASDPACETSVWWAWTPATTGQYIAQLCYGADFPATIAVYTGSSVDSLTEVTSAGQTDKGCQGPNVRIDASLGTTYHIAVSGVSGATGNIYGSIISCASGCNAPTIDAPTTVSNVGTTQATMTAHINPHGLPTTYQFFWTDDVNGTKRAWTPDPAAYVGSDSQTHTVSSVVTGLEPGHRYQFNVIPANGWNQAFSEQAQWFSTQGPPIARTSMWPDVGTTSLTLYGQADPDRYDTTYQFQWGPTTSYGNFSPATPTDVGSGDQLVDASTQLTGLTQGQAYHFRLVAKNSQGTTYGNDVQAATAVKPTVVTRPATKVSTTSATIDGTIFSGNADGEAWFEWGRTPSYGSQTTQEYIGRQVQGNTYSAPLGGLAKDASYHYRAVAQNVAGTSYGADQFFNTGLTGDFNADGHADVLYWNKDTGHVSIWFMGGTNGVVRQTSQEITPDGTSNTAWVPFASVDVNRDGHPDIAYWNKSTGHVSIWFMGGTNGVVRQNSQEITPDGTANTAWVPEAFHDFNGDGWPDIMYWNRSTGHISIWFMGTNGLIRQTSHELSPDGTPNTAWSPFATADFDKNGTTDIAFWNRSTGHISIWFMGSNGVVRQSSQEITPDGTSDTAWIPVAARSVNGDSRQDIEFWNQSTGHISTWFMGGTNGVFRQSSQEITPDGTPNMSWIPID
jgi:hypothetical protein